MRSHPDGDAKECHGAVVGPYPWPRSDGMGTYAVRACATCGAFWEDDAQQPFGHNLEAAQEAASAGFLYGVTAAAFGWPAGKALLLCGRSAYGLGHPGKAVLAGWRAYRAAIPNGGKALLRACADGGPCVDGELMPGEICEGCGLFATNAWPDGVDPDGLAGLVGRLMDARAGQEEDHSLGAPDPPETFVSEWADMCAEDEDDATINAAAVAMADALGVADLTPWTDGLEAHLERHAVDATVQLNVAVPGDAPTRCSLADFLKANRESLFVADEARLRALKVGETLTLGGGAAPSVSITREA